MTPSHNQLGLVRKIAIGLEVLFELMLATVATRLPSRWYFRFYRLHMYTDHDRVPAVTNTSLYAIRIGRAVARIAAIIPLRCVCLQQSLATHRMIRRRGLSPVILFGLRTASTISLPDAKRTPEDPTAHAWVMVGEKIINGARIDLDEYIVVGKYH